MLKEKVSFAGDILPLGQYFFDVPASYDEKVLKKKWKDEVPTNISNYIGELVEGNISSAAAMEDHLQTYADSKEIGKGSLMQPLRWVVSGQAGGPPLFEVLELLGLEEIEKRASIAIDKFLL